MEALDAHIPGRLQQRLRPEHVRAEEPAWVDDGETVVGLGCEVHDDVDATSRDQCPDKPEVADVALYELDAVLDVGE